MINKKLIIVQQFLSWKGHYKQYFENLISADYDYLYCATTSEEYPNATWLKSDFDVNGPLTFSQKIKGRFIDSFKAYRAVGRKNYELIHFIEFEPLTYLLLSGLFTKNQNLLLTIHSADKLLYQNWWHSTLSSLQRKLLNQAIKIVVKRGGHIVNHYKCHRDNILDVIGYQYKNRVFVINYPAPQPKSFNIKTPKDLSNPKFLIYGQIREDKGIYEFLKSSGTEKLQITIAGKILDKRIHSVSYPHLTILDRFLSDEEVDQLVAEHDFMLLPYPSGYTNGAGTFKDSLSMGLPVVTSNIPIFKEIIDEHQVGLIFESVSDIKNIIGELNNEKYMSLSANCYEYALKYNWAYMKNSYFEIYEKLLAK